MKSYKPRILEKKVLNAASSFKALLIFGSNGFILSYRLSKSDDVKSDFGNDDWTRSDPSPSGNDPSREGWFGPRRELAREIFIRYVIQKTLERLCDYVGPEGEVVVNAFSRANLGLMNGGERWKASGKTYGEHIVAFMMATPKKPPERIFKTATLAVNKRDLIMLADPIGTLAALFGPQEKSHFVNSDATFLMGHQFTDPSYQKYVNQFYDYLNDRYGAVR